MIMSSFGPLVPIARGFKVNIMKGWAQSYGQPASEVLAQVWLEKEREMWISNNFTSD